MQALSVPTEIHPDSRRRNRAVRLTFGASAAAKIVAMLCTLAQVPIALRYLGPESYGLWIVLMSFYGLLTFLDFGLGAGLQQQFTVAFAAGDQERLRRTFTTGVRALFAVGVAITASALPLAWFAPWADWLGLVDPTLRAQAPAAVALIVLGCLVNLPANAVACLAAGVQQHWRHSIWNAATNGLTLSVVWLAAAQRWGFLPLVAASALLPVLQNVGMGWQLRRLLGWRGTSPGGLPREEARRMWHASALLAVPQFALAALGWMPALAISFGAGAQTVTAFNLLQRLFGPVVNGHAVVLAPLWPIYAEARLRGDAAWMGRARLWMWLVTGGAIASLGGIALGSEMLLRWWLNSATVAVGSTLTWAAAGWFALSVLLKHFHLQLLGEGRTRSLATHATLAFAAATTGLVAGAAWAGPSAALALGTAGLLCGVPGLAWAASRR